MIRRLLNTLQSFISSRKILDSNFISVKKFTRIVPGISVCFSFLGLEIYLIIFLVFKVFKGVWNPGRKASSISREQRVIVFSWVDFSSINFKARSQRKLTKSGEMFQMLAWTVFRLDTNKTNINFDKIFIL